MCISKTKIMSTGKVQDIKQVAKWIVFIFIYSVYMPDVISNTMDRPQMTCLLLFRSHRLHLTVDICLLFYNLLFCFSSVLLFRFDFLFQLLFFFCIGMLSDGTTHLSTFLSRQQGITESIKPRALLNCHLT